MAITGLRGFNDLLAPESTQMSLLEARAREVFSLYGFSEIRVPTLERTELFLRSIGETTDIVEKQMYTFTDRRGDSITLRPEGTAPVVRAFIEHKLYTAPVTKLFYTGAMFRYERPQKGRFRQFYQLGAEVLGEESARSDAETIEMLCAYLASLGVRDTITEINSLGCSGCRPAFTEALVKFLAGKRDSLCTDCKRRVEKNPLRALDCKSSGCIEATCEAPAITGFLCSGCAEHFEDLCQGLEELGVEAEVNKKMVRGLDYYSKTAFEVTARPGKGGEGKGAVLGSQNSIAAGGRYDTLTEELGGPSVPCFGFAVGLERLALMVKDAGTFGEDPPPAYFIALGAEAEKRGARVVSGLRSSGVPVIKDFKGGTLKSAMKRANRLGTETVLILGEDELTEGVVTVKDMTTGEQERLTFEEAAARLVKNGGAKRPHNGNPGSNG